jgi:Ser-tRNA(Ala) deacylase AlaX
MTKKYFWDDPYATSHQTVVSAVDGGEIELGLTMYFAFSGGQEGDQGTIGGIPMVSARKEGLHIKYTLPADHGLQVDQPVEVNIDWTRRYRLIRLHFAAELVLELFYKKLNGVDKVGAHITEKKVRIDFAWPESIAPLLPDIAEKANQIMPRA